MSDIFDAYAKLALQRGLIKESKDKDLESYKNDVAPRAGSDDIKTIESLYGVKPEGQKYKNNIMEIAHPNKVILTPAYDKINALIENNIERQKIMINITQKPVNGHLTNHKYATSDLMMSLTKISNNMDEKAPELKALADVCLEQLNKKAFDWSDITDVFKGKGSDAVDVIEGAGVGTIAGGIVGALVGVFGGPPGMVAGAATGAVLGAGIAALFKTGPQAKNVSLNADTARNKLGSLMTKFGDDMFLQSLYNALGHVIQTANAYAQLLDQANVQGNATSSKQTAIELGTAYQKEIVQLDRMIDIFLANAKTGRYEPKDEGDFWGKLKAPFEVLTGSALGDTTRSLETLEIVNNQALKGIMETREKMSQAKEDVPAFSPVKAPTEKPVINPDQLAQFEAAMKEFDK